MGPWRIRRPPEWGVDPVPERLRGLRAFDLFVLWASLGVGLLVFVAGSNLLLFFGLSLWEALAVSVAGSIIGSVLLAASGGLGGAPGVPPMVTRRAVRVDSRLRPRLRRVRHRRAARRRPPVDREVRDLDGLPVHRARRVPAPRLRPRHERAPRPPLVPRGDEPLPPPRPPGRA